MDALRTGNSGGRLALTADLIGAVFTGLPVAAAWCGALMAAAAVRPLAGPLTAVASIPAAAVAILLVTVRLLRAVLPRLKAGTCRVGWNRGTLGWYGHMALARAAKASGLRPLLHSFHLTRYLLYRALGAKVAFDLRASIEFVLADPSLVRIGPGCTLGENVYVGGHFFQGGRLILRPVTIGAGCFVGMNSVIGPGTRLGDRTWIGFGNALHGERLPEGSRRSDRVPGRA